MFDKFTTYNIGIVQTKAFRILNLYTTRGLEEYEISANEWAMLGLLNDNEIMKPSDIASALDVKRPYITRLVNSLYEKGLIEKSEHEEDSRANNLSLTEKGKDNVEKIEKDLRFKMSFLLQGAEPGEIRSYFKVLNTFISNASVNVQVS